MTDWSVFPSNDLFRPDKFVLTLVANFFLSPSVIIVPRGRGRRGKPNRPEQLVFPFKNSAHDYQLPYTGLNTNGPAAAAAQLCAKKRFSAERKVKNRTRIITSGSRVLFPGMDREGDWSFIR